MSLAYWCVLAGALIPYVTVGIAKRNAIYDNSHPRQMESYRGLALRAHASHQNGFEAFPLFAIAVIVASRGAPHAVNHLLDLLAGGWLALRLGYTAAYLADRATIRSIVWSVGLVLTVAIFTMPVWAG